jgi:LPS-assembly lipoprotein
MRTKAFTIAAALLAVTTLQGCGFTPMYAKQGLGTRLSDVDFDVPQTRTGYFLGQDLRQTLDEDPSTPKTYTLKVIMSEDHYSIGYRVDDTSTRSEITSGVIYSLIDKRTGKTLTTDHFTETVTYASTSSPFAGIVSQQNGQERLADAVSTRIQGALAVYFHEH